jgi:hypothetical protein
MRELKEHEMEHVAGGAALNLFFDAEGDVIKATGSATFDGHNPGEVFGGHGNLNINDHISK